MTITQKIQAILEHVPATRNSDTELLLIYMQKSGMELTPKQVEIFKNMPSAETIRRTRQKIQQVGKYTAAPEIKAARDYKAIQTRRTIPFMQPDDVERAFDGRIILPFGE